MRELAGVSRLGIVKKKRATSTEKTVFFLNIYPLFVVQRTRRTLTRVSKVNVWAMSSLLGVW